MSLMHLIIFFLDYFRRRETHQRAATAIPSRTTSYVLYLVLPFPSWPHGVYNNSSRIFARLCRSQSTRIAVSGWPLLIIPTVIPILSPNTHQWCMLLRPRIAAWTLIGIGLVTDPIWVPKWPVWRPRRWGSRQVWTVPQYIEVKCHQPRRYRRVCPPGRSGQNIPQLSPDPQLSPAMTPTFTMSTVKSLYLANLHLDP